MHVGFPIISFVSLLVLLAPVSSFADAKKHSVKHFSEISDYIKAPKSTLLVMDNDDTLTMMSCPDKDKPATCQYLGSAAWFSWQQNQVEIKAQPRVANTFNELLTVGEVLFAMNDMAYSAADVPSVLNDLSASGVRLLVATARGNSNTSATNRQFTNLNTHNANAQYSNLSNLISQHSLNFGPKHIASRASPFVQCEEMRPIIYQLGVMYLAGQNKGKMIQCMLDDYHANDDVERITDIVFIDDTEENVEDVYESFKESSEYKVAALHYTALKKHKRRFTQGKMADIYQENAMQRWYKIQQTLNATLQNPAIP